MQAFSEQSSDFGSKVLNLYVMMLNDESDIVRIQAIKCLLSYKTIELEVSYNYQNIRKMTVMPFYLILMKLILS